MCLPCLPSCPPSLVPPQLYWCPQLKCFHGHLNRPLSLSIPLNPPLNTVWIWALCCTSCVYKNVSGRLVLALHQDVMGVIPLFHRSLSSLFVSVESSGLGFSSAFWCCHAKKIWDLETFEPRWYLLCVFNVSQGLVMFWGAAEVQGFLPRCPLFHLQLAELRLGGSGMERWQDKKTNRHVSPPLPPRPTRALT